MNGGRISLSYNCPSKTDIGIMASIGQEKFDIPLIEEGFERNKNMYKGVLGDNHHVRIHRKG